MPAAKSPELRRRAIELVAIGEPVAQIAKGLGMSKGTLCRWVAIDAVDSRRVERLTTAEKRQLVELNPGRFKSLTR